MPQITEQQVREIIRQELSSLIKSDRYVFEKSIQLFDGRNVQLGKTTGTKIGTETSQKMGFFNKTPIVQVSAIDSPSADVTALKTAVDAIRTALTNLGLTA